MGRKLMRIKTSKKVIHSLSLKYCCGPLSLPKNHFIQTALKTFENSKYDIFYLYCLNLLVKDSVLFSLKSAEILPLFDTWNLFFSFARRYFAASSIIPRFRLNFFHGIIRKVYMTAEIYKQLYFSDTFF